MAIVSNMTIYYQRKYRPKGMTTSVIVEDEHIASQLCSVFPSGDPELLHYYQAYNSNYPNYGVYGFTNIYETLNPQLIAAYNPGLIYLDEHYYTWKDFLTPYDIQVIKEWLVGKENDYPKTWNILNEWGNANTKSYSTFYIIDKPVATFWVGEDGRQLILLPRIDVRPILFIGSGTSKIIKKASCSLGLQLVSLPDDVDLSTLDTKTLHYSGYMSVTPTCVYNGEVVDLFSLDYSKGTLVQFDNQSTTGNSATATYYTQAKLKKRFDEWLEDFYKVKFYPLFSRGTLLWHSTKIDNIKYFSCNTSPSSGYWNWMTFLNDVSDTSISPINGFGYCDGNFQDYFLRNDTEQLDSNNPNHKDDPNDRDPGHGPGGSSGDKGGNGDHDNTSDKINLPGLPTLSGSGVGLFTIFNPNASQLAELGKKLWNPTALEVIKQYFSSPMETIIGLGIIPVQPRQGSVKNILLGVYDTEISCITVSSDYVIKDCGSISINRYYGSYLDYDPYTRISLYLPYIGEIQLDPDEVMQTVLGVEYHVNVVTGDCVAIVTSDGSIVYTAAGNCIRQLPIGQTDYSNIINTAVSAVSTIATAVAGGSAASNVGNAVAGSAKTEAGKQVAEARTSSQLAQEGFGAGSSLINQVMQSKMRYNHAGSIGVGSGQLSYQKPYLTIERPNLDLADNYKSYVGYPCNETMTLSHCSGFTQIESCKLSVSGATDGELTEILAFLTEGVII